MRGWTLQKTRTSPRPAKVHSFASPRPYWPRSNWLGSLTEKTLWSKGSWLVNRTVEPTGTTTTPGTNCFSLMTISATPGRAGPGARSSQTTAAPRSRDGVWFPFSSMMIRPATRAPRSCAAPPWPSPSSPPSPPSTTPASSAVPPMPCLPCCASGRAAYCSPTETARSAPRDASHPVALARRRRTARRAERSDLEANRRADRHRAGERLLQQRSCEQQRRAPVCGLASGGGRRGRCDPADAAQYLGDGARGAGRDIRRRSRRRFLRRPTTELGRPHIPVDAPAPRSRSEEHTSELQSRLHLVCRLLLEKKKNKNKQCEIIKTTSNLDIDE